MQNTTGHGLVEIDAMTLKSDLDNGSAILVDVREPSEFAGERIPGAHLAPLSSFAPTKLPETAGKRVILYCRTGSRSAQAGRKLLESGWDVVCHLQGGILAWKEAGYDTERSDRAPISLERQVRIVAGLLIVIGTVLGRTVSPWFLLLSGFVGAGLAFSGFTNACGMAMVLAKLPYNQRI